jgi:hypothetical protein
MEVRYARMVRVEVDRAPRSDGQQSRACLLGQTITFGEEQKRARTPVPAVALASVQYNS